MAEQRRELTGASWPVLWAATGAALLFVVVQPPVGDLWAARARAFAALHGAGLEYWFGWYGGTVPGQYSVIEPFLAGVAGTALVGGLATVACLLLARPLLLPLPHRGAAMCAAAAGMTANLWSGRIPFALGTALFVVAALGVQRAVPRRAGAAAVLCTLASPVCGAFLAFGCAAVAGHDRRRRRSALWAAGAAAATLLALGAIFGVPGPQAFPWNQALQVVVTLLLMLAARPAPAVRTLILLSLLCCVVLEIVPTGLGSNFERFVWIYLPVAVIATGQARRRLAWGIGAAAVAVGAIAAVKDLYIASLPISRSSYTTALVRETDRLPGLADVRVEVVPDGAHPSAYTLLGHAALARGYETQADNQLAAILKSPRLDAASFRAWLDANAVGYVALDLHPLTTMPEYHLVSSGHLPYLRRIWSDGNWVLFAVREPTPIAQPPAHVVRATQAEMTLAVPRAGRFEIRVHWSRFLQLAPTSGHARIEPGGHGWTVLVAARAGRYTLTG